MAFGMACDHPLGRALEWAFEKLGHVEHLSEGALFRYALHSYGGRQARTLADGTVVSPADTVMELHLDNDRVREVYEGAGGGRRAALALVHAIRAGMSEVADLLSADGAPAATASAVFAKTPRRLAEVASRLGFEVRELEPTWRNRVIARIQRGVLKRYDPDGLRRLGADSPELFPVEIWMSRDAALARFGAGGDESLIGGFR